MKQTTGCPTMSYFSPSPSGEQQAIPFSIKRIIYITEITQENKAEVFFPGCVFKQETY